MKSVDRFIESYPRHDAPGTVRAELGTHALSSWLASCLDNGPEATFVACLLLKMDSRNTASELSTVAVAALGTMWPDVAEMISAVDKAALEDRPQLASQHLAPRS